MSVAVIICAAGSSRRYRGEGEGGGGGVGGLADVVGSKLDEDLGGRPVLQRSVELFTHRPEVRTIVVAGPADDDGYASFRDRHGDKLALLGAVLCRGGLKERYETVSAALAVVFERSPDVTHIAVHDAARACTPAWLIDRLFDLAMKHDAVIPGVEVADTLKRVEAAAVKAERDPIADVLGIPEGGGVGGGGGGAGVLKRVVGTVDRAGLMGVQTPQVFRADVLKRAYAQADLSSTDDSQLVERLGVEVLVVPSDPRNIKITRRGDVELARSILGVRGPESRAAHKRF